jgi:hypothetical protein
MGLARKKSGPESLPAASQETKYNSFFKKAANLPSRARRRGPPNTADFSRLRAVDPPLRQFAIHSAA